MLTASVALAATIALVPNAALVAAAQPADPAPDPSWEDGEGDGEPDAEADPEPAPEEETAESPPPPEAAPEPEVKYVQRPVPIPKRKGLGLLISSGILGAFGFGMMAWRMAIVKNSCVPQALDNDPEVTVGEATNTFDTALGCIGAETVSTIGFIFQGTAGAVSWGLAPAGGAKRGKYDAALFVENGGPARKEKVWIGVGAALLGAGLIGRLTVAGVRWDGLLNYDRSAAGRCILSNDTLLREAFECYVRRRQLHFFGQQFTSSAIAAGGGMLAYGLAYLKFKKKFYKDYKQEKVAFSVVPDASFHYTGLRGELTF